MSYFNDEKTDLLVGILELIVRQARDIRKKEQQIQALYEEVYLLKEKAK